MQKKRNKVNKDNSLTHFTFSVLFDYYKREEVEIRHEPYWYDKEQLPSLTSTQIVLFDEIHVQQVCGPPVTSKVNKHNIWFPRDEEGNVDVKNCPILTIFNINIPFFISWKLNVVFVHLACHRWSTNLLDVDLIK